MYYALSFDSASLSVVALLPCVFRDFPCMVKLPVVYRALLFYSTTHAHLDLTMEAHYRTAR